MLRPGRTHDQGMEILVEISEVRKPGSRKDPRAYRSPHSGRADRSDKERQAATNRNSHSTQPEISDLSQDRHVKDFQPVNYDYTGSPVNVTVPQGVQGVLLAAIGGSGGNTTTRGLLPNLGGKGANVGGYALVKQGDTLTINVGQEGQANGSTGGQGGWGATAPGGSAGGTNGGGGGGASSIAVNGSTVAVAGGGGGAGAWGQGSGVDGSSEPGDQEGMLAPVPLTAGRAQTTTPRAVPPAEPVAAPAPAVRSSRARPAAPPSCPTA